MKEEKKIFGFSKNIFFISLVSLFNDISSEMIYPLLPVFLNTVLGASFSFIGIIEGVAETTASLLKLFSGWLSDKFNARKVFVSSGYVIASVIRPMIAFASRPWHVLFIRFADRFGKGIRTSPRDALIADTALPAEKGKAFGFNRAMDNAGGIGGALIASLLLAYFIKDMRTVFALAYIPAAIALFIILFLVKEKKSPAISKSQPLKINLKMFDGNFNKYLLTVLLFTLGNSSDAFLILRAKSAGVSLAAIPIIWIVFNLVKMLTATPGGMLSDKFGRKKVIVAGWLIYFLSYAGFAFAKTPLQVWLLFSFYGIFYGLTEGVEKAFVSDLVRPELRGSGFGTYNFAIGVGALPSSIIMGVLWQKFGVVTAFLWGAGLALLAAVLLWVLVKENKVKP